ncbi:MAG TPA: RDD family protein [Cellulomonadaceae bacterium]|nr:RDD family protein [Cellulomonadaceae bacterium]
MAAREDMGSWLDGGPNRDSATRGSRLGLPENGSGSLAPVGRRVVALFVDWALCTLIASAFLRGQALGPVEVLGVEYVVLLGTAGATIGHRLLGLVVRTPEGAPAGPLRALVRTVLLCLVIPAVVWDADGRGMHDRVAGTVIVRR